MTGFKHLKISLLAYLPTRKLAYFDIICLHEFFVPSVSKN